ncbi:ARM repeat-containing protein [Calocera cornea HHB12733]|uniref:ARM repeat-containing protein n=1 Tax=Calocera cornea HHB12733 TaxID=1353952 RepID=A0A165H2H5_9BASI|nr:ARM repeat-containing protein [Calocera cornea HHB12733]
MAPNSERIQALLERCKHPDTDVKSDAIAKLQLEFEGGAEIPDADSIIATFKPFLRSANPHLSLSVLFALPPLLRQLHTEHTLRHALHAFLAPGTGGLLERMGDGKERTRDGAREAVQALCERCLALGGAGMKGKGGASGAGAGGGKGEQEAVGALLERFLKEGGFGSKVPRTREACLGLLTAVRAEHPAFPLRPYLAPLIDSLQDSDGAVRACAQQTLVRLFGPRAAVSDTARTELKKEAGKKAVRKQIWDPLWARICGAEPVTDEYMVPVPEGDDGLASSQTSESGVRALKRTQSHGALAAAAAGTSRPQSRVGDSPGDADVPLVLVASARDMENEFSALLPPFQGRESEQNWMQREAAIMRVRGMLKGDAWRRLPDAFLAGLAHGFMEGSLKALNSLRTTLSSVTCALYASLASTLRQSFDPFLDVVFLPLLRMSSLTKKLVAQLSQATLTTVLESTSPHARLVLPALYDALGEKNGATRQAALAHLRAWLALHGRQPVEHSSGALDGLDRAVRRGLGDPNPVVREEGRRLFWAFDRLWPDRARPIIDGLDANMRRGLERANPKNSNTLPATAAAAGPAHVAATTPVAAALPPAPATISAGSKTAPTTPAAGPKRTSVREMIQMHREQLKKADVAKLGVAPGSTPPLPRAVTSPPAVQSSSSKPAPLPEPAPLTASTASSVGSPRSVRAPSRTGLSPIRPSHIPAPVHARSPSVPDTPTPTKPRAASAHSRTSSGQAVSEGGGRRVRSPLQLKRASLTHTTSTPNTSRAPRGSRLTSPPAFEDDEVDLTAATMQMPGESDETLLLAQGMPLPGEGDEDETFQPFDFSPALVQARRTPPPTTRSVTAPSKIPISPSRKSHHTRSSLSSNTSNPLFSSPPISSFSPKQQEQVPQSVIEDALRAQAEQAESAANMLLELVEPEEDRTQMLRAPPAALAPSGALLRELGGGKENTGLPRTPLPNRQRSAIRQAAESFKDSPAHSHATPGMLRALSERKHEAGLWQRKIAPLNGSKFSMEPEEQADILDLATTSLASGTATSATLRDMARICASNPCDATSPTPSGLSTMNGFQNVSLPEIWNGGKAFDGLFDALMKFLVPERNGELLEFGLVLLWEMLENQRSLLDGRQMEMFTALLNVRWCNLPNVLLATNAIRDGITTQFDPVFGVTQLNACLRAFVQQPVPAFATETARSATYAFGLVGLGKFIMRLPAEILEDELPRLKGLLLAALTDKSSEVREAASLAVVAAQLVLQDEIHLFMLLDGLDNGKKNLLIYYFEKYKIRSADDTVTHTHRRQGSGQELIEKEMNRLDMRATPPRTSNLRPQAIIPT